jgi:hypothetical protein
VSVYVDSDDFKKSLSLDGTTFADDDIDRAIAAASRSIDGITGRSFSIGEDDEARLYRAIDPQLLRIDDLSQLTSVRVDRDGDGTFEETWSEGTDFQLQPLNASTLGHPWTSIGALDKRFPTGSRDVVEVTGSFGWAAIPESIIQATIILSSRLLVRSRQAPLGLLVGGSERGSFSPIGHTDPDVLSLVNQYVRVPIFH